MKKTLFLTIFTLLSTSIYCQNVKAIEIIPLYEDSPANTKIILDPFQEKVNDSIINNPVSNNPSTQKPSSTSSNFENGGPENMIDKSTLKPSAGGFSSDITAISDNLNQGKVSINIPLFDFEYYDYKIPVFINNNYPQTMSQTYGSPVFYINSKIGGDWNLSIDQYKVSRQINGNEDEHPSKGYFSSFSQSRVNNISAINNGDVVNGLKGSWDPAIDVFHFSTPTISGSFLLNLIDGSFKNLTGGNFTVKYTRNNTSLLSFTVTDELGTQYLFGGDDSSTEQTQSKTDVQSRGVDYNGLRFKYIVEVQSVLLPTTYGKVVSFIRLPDNANYYFNTPSPSGPVVNNPWTDSMINDFLNNRHLNQVFPTLGSLYPLGNNIYGIPASNRIVNLPGTTTDDPDLRQPKVNTAWYLKEIKLINGKKILFSYQNSWKAYPTYSANKTELTTLKTGIYNYPGTLNTYPGQNNTIIPIPIRYYPCMPEGFGPLQFPINESYAETINFVRAPELTQIYDEDLSSQIEVATQSATADTRPFVSDPRIFSNVPQEVINGGIIDPKLTNKITYIKNHQSFDVEFKNSSYLYPLVKDNVTYRAPSGDSSYLNELVINGDKKYSFTYNGRNLKTITYPTGAKKQFYSSARTQGLEKLSRYGNFYLYSEGVVDSIITTSGKNKTVEKYVYSKYPQFYTNNKTTQKTFRPGIATCTDYATFTSTNPIMSNVAVKNGLYFANAKKYINNELRISSDNIQQTYADSNTLYLTDGTTPSYTNKISSPTTAYEQRYGLNAKTIQYKKNAANKPEKQQTSDIKYEFTTPTFELPSVYLANIEAGPWSNTSGAIRRGYSRFYYPVGDEVTKTVVTDSIFLDNNTNIKTEKTSFFSRFIHTTGTSVNKLTKMSNTDSEGNTWTTEFLNVNSGTRNLKLTDSPLFQSMRKNNISPDLFKIEYKNNDIINFEAYKYKLLNINNNIPVLESQKKVETSDTNLNSIVPFTVNSSDPNNFIYDARFKDKIIYDQYDNNGRLIDYHIPDGPHTIIIWGYKRQYPIAKIENATYSEVQPYIANLQSLSDVDYDNCTTATCKEQILRNALNNLRNIPNLSNKWQVSTFTYDYNIGLTSSTDPKGTTNYYEYDKHSRLTQVRDENGKIVTANKYHYKTE